MSGASIFGHLPDGRTVEAIHLQGPMLSATVLTLGATVQDLRLAGHAPPLVLGFPSVAPYLGEGLYVGALVGRVANRIGGARFPLEGHEVRVEANENGNQLHGGPQGIHCLLWQVTGQEADRVTMELELPDGDMGFPGRLTIRAEISVAGDALSFDLSAEADAATPVNLAHHGYFCLDDSGDIRGHRLQVAADHWLPVDAALIPTGEIAPVDGTVFDFREGRQIAPAGYDHNLCISPQRQALREVATLTSASGLSMSVETTEAGLQIYDGRHFNGLSGLEGRRYERYAGLALETQAWPDAVNHPGFPDTILQPGETYRALTRYRFQK